VRAHALLIGNNGDSIGCGFVLSLPDFSPYLLEIGFANQRLHTTQLQLKVQFRGVVRLPGAALGPFFGLKPTHQLAVLACARGVGSGYVGSLRGDY
jgi:hypothetical protein